jgi:hypothetical protein
VNKYNADSLKGNNDEAIRLNGFTTTRFGAKFIKIAKIV